MHCTAVAVFLGQSADDKSNEKHALLGYTAQIHDCHEETHRRDSLIKIRQLRISWSSELVIWVTK